MPFATVLLNLLLQAPTPTQGADVRFAEWMMRLIPIALSVYVLLSGRSRESRKALDKNISDLLTFKEVQQATNTQHQLGMEKVGDEMKRGYQEQGSKISQLSEMKTDLAVVKSQMQGYSESFRELNAKMDRLLNQGK